MELGFIGTGAITQAIVTGLANAPNAPREIWVSPRSPLRARKLAATYSVVRIAADNQEVLDKSDTVMLAIRPQIAHSVLESLVFRESHRCISLIAGFSHAALYPLIYPAVHCVRATPTPCVAQRRGPISVFPFDADTLALFAQIGELIPARNAAEFDALLSCSAEMASFFKTLHSCVEFMTAKGLPESTARRYAGSLFTALAQTAVDRADRTLAQLAEQHATPGGINEQIAHELAESGVFAAHERALERIFARLSAAQWAETPGPQE